MNRWINETLKTTEVEVKLASFLFFLVEKLDFGKDGYVHMIILI